MDATPEHAQLSYDYSTWYEFDESNALTTESCMEISRYWIAGCGSPEKIM
jgi:hypothetical protein